MKEVSLVYLFLVAVVVSSAAAHPSTAPIEEHRQIGEVPRSLGKPRPVQELVPAIAVDTSLRKEHEELTQVQSREQTTEILKTETLPTVKCAEIVPQIGEPSPDNHDACHAHCVTLAQEYERGKCLRGVCHCHLRRRQSTDHPTPTVLQTIEREGHPTVRCEHIVVEEIVGGVGGVGAPESEACKSHCNTLGHEYPSGECVRGICHCKKHTRLPKSSALEEAPVPATPRATTTKVVRPSSTHPTVKCEHLVPLNGEPSSESHELCLVHCHSLGDEFGHGQCIRGVCHCERRPDSGQPSLDSGLPTVRCEHIVPLAGQPASENHEACSSHCVQIGGHYKGGECVSGVCNCKVGVAASSVPPSSITREEVIVGH